MAIMKELSTKYKKTAMVLDRIVLVNQTSTRLARYGINHGVMQSDHWRFRPMERIQICSAQTLEKRENFPDIDLMIIDECHVQRKSVVDYVKKNPSLKVIGLTATPFTKGLGTTYSNVVGAKSTGDLIDSGWLTPLKIFIAKEIDMTGVKKVAGEWSPDAVTERGMQITGDIVSEWIKNTNEIFGGPKKTVVFCAGVDHGRDLERQFKEQGFNFVAISYKEDDEFKAETIEEFSKPDSDIHGLIATDILTRGFDVPDVMIGVSARPFSKSFSSHVQQMGRVMRPFEGKKFGVWLDHSGNYLRFRDDWDKLFSDGVTDLDDSVEKTKKELTEKEKAAAKCPACGSLWIWPSNVCGECGHQKRLKQVIAVAGELHELGMTGRQALAQNQTFYSELLYYAKIRDYKDGWAAFKYKEKYGYWPNGLQKTTLPTSSETASFIKSRNIAWSKSKART
jgi:superfamily II DNA or RNA helicase